MGKWATAGGIYIRTDRRVLRGWKKTVHECIDERMRFLKQRWLNKSKKKVLRNRLGTVRFLIIIKGEGHAKIKNYFFLHKYAGMCN